MHRHGEHACVLYVQGEQLTNSSLRERFGVPQTSSGSISRLIKEAVNNNLIKPFDPETSNKYKKYVPIWAWSYLPVICWIWLIQKRKIDKYTIFSISDLISFYILIILICRSFAGLFWRCIEKARIMMLDTHDPGFVFVIPRLCCCKFVV